MDNWICPKRCAPKDMYGNDIDTPFFYSASQVDDAYKDEPRTVFGIEQGVLAYSDLTASNRWQDGTAGVPGFVRNHLYATDSLPYCIKCHSEVVRNPGV